MILINILMFRIQNSLAIEGLFANALFIFAVITNAFFLKKLAYKSFCRAHRGSRSVYIKNISSKYVSNILRKRLITWKKKAGVDLVKHIGARIFILKSPSGNEKGVLLLKFNPVIDAFISAFDVEKLMEKYYLVLEPSWTGVCNDMFLQYTQYSDPVFILTATDDDYMLLAGLGSNLIPVKLGACHWVSPDDVIYDDNTEKKYDLVMNSNWAPWKKHYLLFSQMCKLKRKIKVALIGVPYQGYDRKFIEKLAKYYGVLDQIDIFERIPHEEVIKIVGSSRVGILLSNKEGCNRAVSEYLFCDLPVILLRDHVGGAKLNINKHTGLLVKEKDIASSIFALIEACPKSPREWAMNNISCYKSTEKLNNKIRATIEAKGWTWNKDIVVRKNAPEPKYVDSIYEKEFLGSYEELKEDFHV